MLAETGIFLLIVALLTAVLQSLYLVPALRPHVTPCIPASAFLQALCVTLSLVILATLRLDNDFSVTNVIFHSNLTLPVLFKITGTWGNHEGSMLLWAWVLAIFGLIFSLRSHADRELKHTTLSIQSFLAVGVLLFIILTSNPFARQFPPTADGEALNPILQDVALAIHPPLLYLGYVGFSIVFSLAVAAMLRGTLDKNWAAMAHPWIVGAWAMLTLGIGLGSWWAYRELGWGGWWFWDPVENASLMPWLSGLALLHSNIVLKKRNMLAAWVLLLAILTFGLSLIGTFLVRSGALTSVHSFASDPTRGMFILGYIVVTIGGALLLYGLRAGRLGSADAMLPVSREGMIVINNLFVLTACATVVLGTLYPLLVEWLQDSKLTVGPPYFNATFLPLMAIPLFFAGLVPFMPWKQASFAESLHRAVPAFLATGAWLLLLGTWLRADIVFALAGFGLSGWLVAANIQWFRQSGGVRGALSVFLGHLGAAVIVAGITGVGLWKAEAEARMEVGETLNIASYGAQMVGVTEFNTDNYKAKKAVFFVRDGDKVQRATLSPEYRNYTLRSVSTSEAAIHSRLFSDIYLVIGETGTDGRVSVRAYYVPMISFIWTGFMLMAMGGVVSLLSRFNRVIP